uniref:Uncharacterized protein n=1 Tax=Glossina austeni TaxID=7395 RepID=A0A1A9UND3_GLOAU
MQYIENVRERHVSYMLMERRAEMVGGVEKLLIAVVSVHEGATPGGTNNNVEMPDSLCQGARSGFCFLNTSVTFAAFNRERQRWTLPYLVRCLSAFGTTDYNFYLDKVSNEFHSLIADTSLNSLWLKSTVAEFDETKAPRRMDTKSSTPCARTTMWNDLIQVASLSPLNIVDNSLVVRKRIVLIFLLYGVLVEINSIYSRLPWDVNISITDIEGIGFICALIVSDVSNIIDFNRMFLVDIRYLRAKGYRQTVEMDFKFSLTMK